MSDDLTERVARAMWMADVDPYDPADRIPFEQAPESAQAYCRAEARAAIAVVLEEAAQMVEFSPDSHTAREMQLMLDKAAAIRALMKEPTDPGHGSDSDF